MNFASLIKKQTEAKLQHLEGFDKDNKYLKKLAKYLNKLYCPDQIWDPVLIAGKLYELQQQTGVEITPNLIELSVKNHKEAEIPFRKDLEHFIISFKTIDDIQEFSSDLLTFSNL